MKFKGFLVGAVALTLLTVTTVASAALVVLRGALEASQVVAPVYQLDASGHQVLDSFGNPIVIGSTSIIDGHPVSTSAATGFATVTVDTIAQTISTDFSWSGLSGNADRAHLHDAPAGVTRLLPPNDRFFHEVIADQFDALGNAVLDSQGNPTNSVVGGYVLPCFPTFGYGCAPASGSLHDLLFLDPSQFDPLGGTSFVNFNALLMAFETDGLFLDIHTQLYPGGEIRGQLLFNQVPEPNTLVLVAIALIGAARLGSNATIRFLGGSRLA